MSRLKYISRLNFHVTAGAHVVVSTVKNEAFRLPYFLNYYRKLGFDKFIFVDNDSDDGTREYLLEQPDVAVFHTDSPYLGSCTDWKNGILDRFCAGHWVGVVDADEILVWKGSEQETIQSLSARMVRNGDEALFTVMLDMYSSKPFDQICYRSGEPFVQYAPYFDHGPYFFKRISEFPYIDLWGGVRSRIWKALSADFHPPNQGKVPFLFWRSGQRFTMSQHRLLHPMKIASTRGALLHFKMLDDLFTRCEEGMRGGQYYEGGRELAVLLQFLRLSKGRSLCDPAFSVQYSDSEQLGELALIEDDAHSSLSVQPYRGIVF